MFAQKFSQQQQQQVLIPAATFLFKDTSTVVRKRLHVHPAFKF
jgi:hypothetical protein